MRRRQRLQAARTSGEEEPIGTPARDNKLISEQLLCCAAAGGQKPYLVCLHPNVLTRIDFWSDGPAD